jgi:predicted CXXCH cytochrome family protein
MRRHVLVLGVILAVAGLTSLAFAGDFHHGTSLVCSDCHVMHFSQQHGYNADGTGSFTPLGSGPNHALLRDDVNDLCLSCHNGQSFAPDVFEAHGNGYVRQAGALNEVGGNGQYAPAAGHTLGATATAPGGTWSNPDGLECTDCHAAHGSGSAGGAGVPVWNSYRNLAGYGTGSFSGHISYTNTTDDGPNPATAWVHEDAKGGTNASHYGVGAIAFNEPDETKSAYANFCKACHTDFHGAVGGTEIGGSGAPPAEFVRHPVAEVQIGALTGGHSGLSNLTTKLNQVQVMSPTGQKAGGYDGTDTGLTPSCMSCHKGHGNQNAFGLIYMAGTGTIDEQGDDGTTIREMCRQCHGQGAP